jgi:putative DNA primase/helicase
MKTKFDDSMNSTVIFLGEKYNLIGVDVDDKEDTLDFFQNLASENNFILNDTLTVKTLNDGGMHYYFRLSKEQMKKLNPNNECCTNINNKNNDTFFTASTGMCFSTAEQKRYIDIKYNNQVFFGPSYFNINDSVKTYHIQNDTPPTLLPKFLFDEIYKVYLNNTKQVKPIKNTKKTNKIENKTNEIPNITQNSKNKIDTINRLRLYLNCLKNDRFDDREDWLRIGAIIFNETNNIDLFIEYSKKSPKYEYDGCITLWNSFKENRDKKVTIKKLIELAEEDTTNDRTKLYNVVINDKKTIIDTLFEYVSDVYIAFLFYNTNKNDFIYDKINKSWYAINNYGIYIKDKDGDLLKKKMNICLTQIIKKEYLDKINNISEDSSEYKKKMNTKYYELLKYCGFTKNKNNILTELKSLYSVDKIFEKMNKEEIYLVGFTNGVLDLKTNKFRNAEPHEFISVTTGYEYKEPDKEKMITAKNILFSIFENNDKLCYVLKILATGFIGVNRDELIHFFIGTGGNAKSLIRDIASLVFGEYYDTMDIAYLSQTKHGVSPNAPNPIMARKKDCRIVFSTEPDKSTKYRVSTLKSLSGNDPIQCRFLNCELFEYTPKFGLFILSNIEPSFIDEFGESIARRIRLISFPFEFKDSLNDIILPHHRLKNNKLKEELPKYKVEFMHILLEHYYLYIKEGLVMPYEFKNITDEFIKNNLPVNEWMKKNLIITKNPKDKVKTSILYENYVDYMENDIKGVTQSIFKNHLVNMGIKWKHSNGSNFYGIKLINNDVENYDSDDAEKGKNQ